ncbi:MAG: sulfur carrier protein ThiS [Candidatus Rokubacteria bacterium]|nr:sulfur carrier protein ThiS [Candidatus Rokubacteria bacterium]
MKITVNGKAMEVADAITIEGLLSQLEVRRDYTAVALNREVLPKHSHAKTVLREGDRVEIVHPMQGG